MRIVNDKLVGDNVVHTSTTKKSKGKLKPKFLVIHYTASQNYKSDVQVLSSSSAKVSCHLVIGPNGEVTQIGDFTDILWHAGASEWKGYNSLNSYSIGIEVTCPGWLTDDMKIHSGSPLSKDWTAIQAKHKNPNVHYKNWAAFTTKQIDALKEIGMLLMDHYNLDEALGHDQIAPNRKIDPGPCCPDSVFSYLNGNADKDEIEEEVQIVHVTGGYFEVHKTGKSGLNLRRTPDATNSSNVVGKIPDGTKLKVESNPPEIKEGFVYVSTPAGYKGYVSTAFIKPA